MPRVILDTLGEINAGLSGHEENDDERDWGRSTDGDLNDSRHRDATAFRRWILRRDPETQPFPMAEPTTSGNGVGQVVTCSPPKWDLERGGAPTSIEYQWHTVTTIGAAVFPTPIPGANSSAFTIAPGLRGKSIQCQVKARNAFGVTGTLSAPIVVTD